MFSSVSTQLTRTCSSKSVSSLSLLRQFSSLRSDGLPPNPRLVRVPENFVVPVPKPLMVADGNYKGAVTALLAATIRLTSGIFVSGWQPRAKCQGEWPGAAGVALSDGDQSFSGSRAIIEHLFTAYGPGAGKIPFSLTECWGLTSLSSKCATRLRGSAGGKLSENALPRETRDQLQVITLWGFEGSPFVRPVREALCSLGLRHRLISCARGSQNRDKLFALTGRFQAPYLQDPNTGVNMFESGDIVKYLHAAYTVESSAQHFTPPSSSESSTEFAPSVQP